MQKKIIALAVAGLVSTGAFAQSNVTIDGIMDMGYQYSWGTKSNSNTKDMSEVKAGGWDGSRVGFHGTEDLGNGLKAGFDATIGYDADTGKSYGNALTSEGADLYLSNAKWGVVKAGYFSSFLDSDISGLDASGRHAFTAADQLISTGKLANHIAYITPDLSGFKASVGYSSNVNGGNNQDAAPVANSATSSLNIRAYEIGGIYKNGGLGLGIGYIGYRPQNTDGNTVAKPALGDAYEWQAGGSYDFKVAAVSLYYAATHSDLDGPRFGVLGSSTGTGALSEKSSTWALGVSVPVTAADLVTFSYADRKTDFYNGVESDKTSGFGVFYAHNLSKRTALYAIAGTFNGDSKENMINGNYQNAINVGVHHLF